jgi:hypothetical protein
MSEFYDFLGSLGYKPHAVSRMNLRHRHIIEPWRNEIEGSRVLDLGSHDGRWGYAFAAAGAASVLGIEGRAELAAQYASLPDSPFKDKVQLVIGDFVTEMDHLIAEKACFDIVACLGVYYHTMEHYRMMLQMASFKPRLIIIASHHYRQCLLASGMRCHRDRSGGDQLEDECDCAIARAEHGSDRPTESFGGGDDGGERRVYHDGSDLGRAGEQARHRRGLLQQVP